MLRRLRHLVLLCAGLAIGAPALAQSLEDAVLEEINFARTQPREYAQELRRYRATFEGRIASDSEGEYLTFEGVRPVDEAIRFLETQRPLEPLTRGRVLALAAADHADEQGRRGSRGHMSADGASPARRVALRGGGRYVAETIAYGRADPAAIVRSLIVDDGVPTRTHRAVIFMSYLRYAGVGCGPHAVHDYVCVMDYSQTSDGRTPTAPSLARSNAIRSDDAAF